MNKRRTISRGSQRGTHKPIIGMTCEIYKRKPYFTQFDLTCDYRYVRAILRAGGIPLILPINPFHRGAARILKHIHGLVIVGGADIHPSFYGEKPSDKLQPTYRGRTYFEMQLYRAAQRKKIPVLAICHGLQLLNVIYGGTVYQDIRSEFKGARNHRSKVRPMHRVTVRPGSLYHRVFRKKSFMVHCEHHQAVKRVGRTLEITAVAEDGVPEAIEGPPRTLAVQWHPERQPKDPVQARLFSYFIRLCRS